MYNIPDFFIRIFENDNVPKGQMMIYYIPKFLKNIPKYPRMIRNIRELSILIIQYVIGLFKHVPKGKSMFYNICVYRMLEIDLEFSKMFHIIQQLFEKLQSGIEYTRFSNMIENIPKDQKMFYSFSEQSRMF